MRFITKISATKNFTIWCWWINWTGDLYDFTTIKSDTGSFQQGDNSVVFDWKQNNQLAYLPVMDEGKVEFWIKLKDDLSRLSQPELNNKAMIGPAREDFVTKISSKLELAQKVFFNDEIFGNSGPIPPQVGRADDIYGHLAGEKLLFGR